MTFTNTTNPYWAERWAIDCLLRPTPVVDLDLADRLADTALTAGSSQKERVPYFQACKAMSSYRLGRYAESITWAEKSIDNAQAYASAQACAVLSMAHWQLGRSVEARQMLARGEALVPGTPDGWWVDWLIARVEIDEAKALTQSQPSRESIDKP